MKSINELVATESQKKSIEAFKLFERISNSRDPLTDWIEISAMCRELSADYIVDVCCNDIGSSDPAVDNTICCRAFGACVYHYFFCEDHIEGSHEVAVWLLDDIIRGFDGYFSITFENYNSQQLLGLTELAIRASSSPYQSHSARALYSLARLVLQTHKAFNPNPVIPGEEILTLSLLYDFPQHDLDISQYPYMFAYIDDALYYIAAIVLVFPENWIFKAPSPEVLINFLEELWGESIDYAEFEVLVNFRKLISNQKSLDPAGTSEWFSFCDSNEEFTSTSRKRRIMLDWLDMMIEQVEN